MGDGGLLRILEEAHETRREEIQEAANPTECPICGAPLDYNEKRGLLNCPFGHYRIAGRK